jgi:hypothetical protein
MDEKVFTTSGDAGSSGGGDFGRLLGRQLLHHPAALQALVLDDAPIAVRLVVVLSPGLPQKHNPANLARRIQRAEWGRRSSLQPFSTEVVQYSHGITNAYRTDTGPKSDFPGANPRSRVKSRTFGGERPKRARRQRAAPGWPGFAACHRASASRGFETDGSMISC